MVKEKGRVTLQDIADATGFTVNTVSRALKNKEDISPKTCALIQQVARDIGFLPSQTTRKPLTGARRGVPCASHTTGRSSILSVKTPPAAEAVDT